MDGLWTAGAAKRELVLWSEMEWMKQKQTRPASSSELIAFFGLWALWAVMGRSPMLRKKGRQTRRAINKTKQRQWNQTTQREWTKKWRQMRPEWICEWIELVWLNGAPRRHTPRQGKAKPNQTFNQFDCLMGGAARVSGALTFLLWKRRNGGASSLRELVAQAIHQPQNKRSAFKNHSMKLNWLLNCLVCFVWWDELIL